MVTYFPEDFSPDEAEVLGRHFTNLDRQVFAVANLPVVVTTALFARFARTNKSLRRLFLDEFATDLNDRSMDELAPDLNPQRVRQLYDKSFNDFGHESVAQFGGIHIVCEQLSNLVALAVLRGRLGTYAEQGTRYVAYDSRSRGRYRYLRDPDIVGSRHGAAYIGQMDRLFDIYSELLAPMSDYFRSRLPKNDGDADFSRRHAIKSAAIESLRGILPLATISNVGMFASIQQYQRLLVRLDAHPLSEARMYGALIQQELSTLVPSFVAPVGTDSHEEHLADWEYNITQRMSELTARLFEGSDPEQPLETCRLVDWDPEGELKVIAAMCFPYVNLSDESVLDRVRNMSESELDEVVDAYAGERADPRFKPGRALERSVYRFDIVTDHSSFRLIQRHRILSLQRQRLTPAFGYVTPGVVEAAGVGDQFGEAMECSAELFERLSPEFPESSPYALANGFAVRFSIDLNARTALHIMELRTSTDAHPTVRAIAQEMHSQIATIAGHRRLARLMRFVKYDTDPADG